MPRCPLRSLPALLLCAGLWEACKPSPSHPLQVEYAGCAQVFLPGPVCVLGNKHRQMRLWVGQPPEVPVEVQAGGRRLQSPAVAVQGGQRLTVDVPPATPAIEVRSRTAQGDATWVLKLTTYPRSSPETAAFQMWKEGRKTEARHLLESRIRSLPGGERWLSLGILASFARAEGDDEKAAAFCRQAIPADRAAGSLRAESKDTTLLAWILIQQHQLSAAQKVLSGLQLPAGSPAEAAYERSYHRGLLAEQLGDARTALADLTDAAGQAERVGLEKERWDAEQVLGRQLGALGRSREAAVLFDRLHHTPPRDLSPCEWAVLLTNHAWSLLLAGEAGAPLGDPVPLLEEAEHAAERAPCPAPEEQRLNDLLNLTLAHLQGGRRGPARASLSAARALDRFATPLDRLWSLELEARLDLAEGRPEAALRLYERLEELAAGASSPEGRWRAAYGRARCYRAMGRSSEALAAFGQAEALLDEQSLQIPIHEGRETFTAQREGATGLYLEVLLAGGRNAEALEVARRARSRVLRQLARGDRLAHLPAAERERWEGALAEYRQQRTALDADAAADWELPADQSARQQEARAARYKEVQRVLDQAFTALGGRGERAAGLVPFKPGEVVLAYHPLSHGWVGFAAAGGTVAVHRFELPESSLPDLPKLAALLLAPFRAQIERAERVRILPYGRLRGVDFHALPFGGDILLAARPVVYGLDLAVPAGGQPPGRRALVVADPSGNLPAAVREAEAVTAALRGQSWNTEALRGEKAREAAVRPALERVDLLHYAGHGTFSGFGGWESVLPLAGGTRLTLGDVLTLGRAPSWVVLSGCETGGSSAEAPVEGLGLAQAFLLAGSRSVIAATRTVGDRAAEGLFAELYRHWGAAPDLALLLQRAQLAWRQREPGAGWASFRLFEP